MNKLKQFLYSLALIAMFSLGTAATAQARPVYTESGSYVDANGCIHITYNVEHRFLGINWYTTFEDVTSIC